MKSPGPVFRASRTLGRCGSGARCFAHGVLGSLLVHASLAGAIVYWGGAVAGRSTPRLAPPPAGPTSIELSASLASAARDDSIADKAVAAAAQLPRSAFPRNGHSPAVEAKTVPIARVGTLLPPPAVLDQPDEPSSVLLADPVRWSPVSTRREPPETPPRDEPLARPPPRKAERVPASQPAIPQPARRAVAGSDHPTLPRRLFSPPADYPPREYRARIGGRVVLRAHLAREGHVVTLEVQATSGNAALDEAAMAAVRRWRFEADSVAQPTARVVDIPLRFVPPEPPD